MNRAQRAPLTVMQLLDDPSKRAVINPYVSLLTRNLPSDRVVTRWFRWRGILTDSFDVLHVHWPEHFLRHPKVLGRVAKRIAFALFLARLRWSRKAVVRTLHNDRPHESGTRVERWLLACLDRLTNRWIVMNEASQTPPGAARAMIPHGHYRDWYEVPAGVEQVRGRLMCFGRVRAYKGVDELLRAFTETNDQSLSLRVMGMPDRLATRTQLEQIANDDERVELNLEFVPDTMLVREILQAEAVILPHRDLLNSGTALLALSLNRPVIMRDVPATRMLAAEFGDEWISLFSGPVTGSRVTGLLEEVRSRARPDVVDMQDREWRPLANSIADVYENAAVRR